MLFAWTDCPERVKHNQLDYTIRVPFLLHHYHSRPCGRDACCFFFVAIDGEWGPRGRAPFLPALLHEYNLMWVESIQSL